IKIIATEVDFPDISHNAIVFDGLYGSGLTRPLRETAAALAEHINRAGTKIIAIDIPSGLMGEENPAGTENSIIRANLTLTLQFPKISLLFPENELYTGEVRMIDIGLHPVAIAQTPTPFFMIDREMVGGMLPKRKKFSHKGAFGHALLIAGSYGKMGAASLAARGCLRAGVGLLTVHVPKKGVHILQTTAPEAMCSIDSHKEIFSAPPTLENYNAIGIGPGTGMQHDTQSALFKLLKLAQMPMVIDADALNIIAQNKTWLEEIPQGSILTPHLGELRRLFGEFDNSWQRLLFLQKTACKYKIVIVLKGAYTAIITPEQQVFFNPTGNHGMATGGSGDVLTGIILGLLAQKIPSVNAAIAGVYLHGISGDLAARKNSMPALVASDLCKFLGKAFSKIYNVNQDF
ncbi:MAG: NAD(P)H-hydrate dehydratase, partial [Prolixibacteraceae bacterium]|nr:NAD(P)H-hydrate dehydratase [Prolixibacteraceae bacterium]